MWEINSLGLGILAARKHPAPWVSELRVTRALAPELCITGSVPVEATRGVPVCGQLG